MAHLQPQTDRAVSAASNEFIWDIGGHTEIHRHITAPIVTALGAQRARRVLDLGCGNGAFTATLQTKGYTVTGLDHSRSGINLARRRWPSIEFAQHDIQSPLPEHYHGVFDAVVCVEVIEHLLLPRTLLENALSALRPGGSLILTTPYHGYFKNLALALTNKFDDHWHPLRDFGHVKFFSRRTITALFNEYHISNVRFMTVGRIRPFARSMLISGIKPV